MRRVCIFFGDKLFARYLKHEIKAFCHADDIEVVINDSASMFDSDADKIVILDLDSSYADVIFSSEYVIGIYSCEKNVTRKNNAKFIKCIHRPFTIRDLTDIVSGILSGGYKDGSIRADSDYVSEDKMIFVENELSVIYRGNKIRLSGNEYRILSLLDRFQGETVSRNEINLALGGEFGNMCDVYMCRLRSKFAAVSNEKIIYTVRNKGYMLKNKNAAAKGGSMIKI